jgi:hypothetical protein
VSHADLPRERRADRPWPLSAIHAIAAFVNPFTSDGAADFSLNQEPRTDLLRVGE